MRPIQKYYFYCSKHSLIKCQYIKTNFTSTAYVTRVALHGNIGIRYRLIEQGQRTLPQKILDIKIECHIERNKLLTYRKNTT